MSTLPNPTPHFSLPEQTAYCCNMSAGVYECVWVCTVYQTMKSAWKVNSKWNPGQGFLPSKNKAEINKWGRWASPELLLLIVRHSQRKLGENCWFDWQHAESQIEKPRDENGGSPISSSQNPETHILYMRMMRRQKVWSEKQNCSENSGITLRLSWK